MGFLVCVKVLVLVLKLQARNADAESSMLLAPFPKYRDSPDLGYSSDSHR